MAISKKDLAVLKVALRMEAAQFRKEAKKTRNDIKGLGTQFKNFGRQLKNSLAGFAAAAASIAGVRAAFGGLLAEMQKTEAVARMADRIGTTTEFISAMQWHFENAGATAEQVNTVLQRLTKRVGQAQMGSKEAQKAFEGLGIAWETLRGRSTEEAVYRVFLAMRNLGQGAEQVAKSVGLGDTEIGQLLSGIQELPGSFDEVIDKAKEFNAVITEDMGDAAKQFNATIKEFQDSWSGFKRDLAFAVGPSLQKWLESWRLVLQSDGQGGGPDRAEQLRKERQEMQALLERQQRQVGNYRGGWAGPAVTDSDVQATRRRIAEISLELNQIHQQEMDARREREQAEKDEAQAAKDAIAAEKERVRLMDVRAKMATEADRRIAEERMKEVDRLEREAEAERLREAFRTNLDALSGTAPGTQGVGAVGRGSVAGFSAVQAGFRAQQRAMFLDSERNRLIEETNRKLDRLGEERVAVRI